MPKILDDSWPDDAAVEAAARRLDPRLWTKIDDDIRADPVGDIPARRAMTAALITARAALIAARDTAPDARNMADADTIARDCLRSIRGCATDYQYTQAYDCIIAAIKRAAEG